MTYNKHIFDVNNKKVLRDFEGAYKNFDNVYQGQFNIHSPKFRLVMDKINDFGKNCKVLDIGAGYGVFLNHLLSQNIDAVGVEISQTAIEKGKEKYGNLPLYEGDLTKGLAFSKNLFDVIVCFGVVNYILDCIDFSFNEIKKILKPDGILTLSMGFKDTNIFFKDIVSCEQDFLNLVGKHFKIENFLVHYHEIEETEGSVQNLDIRSQSRDLIVFCRNI